MTDVALLVAQFDTTDLKDGVVDMKAVATQAVKTEAAVSRVGPSAVAATRGMSTMAGQGRMLSQQLSQVAQQGMVTGQWAQAFSIQAADIGVAFGPLGAAIGVVAMIGLPMLVSAFGGGSDSADRLATALDDLDAAAGRAKKSSDALATAYAGANKEMLSFLGTVAAADKLAAMKAMSDAVDQIADGWVLFSTNKGNTTGFVTNMGAELALTLQQAKDLQDAFDTLATADGFAAQTDAAKALYAQLIAIYGRFDQNQAIFDAMPAKIQEIAKALAQTGIAVESLSAPLPTISEAMKGIGDWAFRANGQMHQFAATGIPASASLDDNLSHTASLSFGNLDAIPPALQPAIDGAYELYGVLFQTANLSFGNLAALSGQSYTPDGFGSFTPSGGNASSLITDPFAVLTPAITHLGSSAGGAAPKIDTAQKKIDEAAVAADKLAAAQQRATDAQVGAIQSLGTIAQSIGAGDIGGALGGLSGLGSSLKDVGGGLGKIGSAISGLAPGLAIVGLLFDAFRTTTTILADGISGTITDLGVSAQQYQTIKKSSFFGLINRTSTTTSTIGGDAGQSLTDAFAAMQSGVEGAAGLLGIGAAAFKDFTYSFNVSLQGLSDADKQAAISQAFTAASDAMAEIALAGYDIPGSGAAAYLTELGNDLTGFNAAARMLGYSVMGVSVASGVAAASVVGLYGSLDAFIQATDYYFQTFYSTSEQLTSVTSDLAAQLNVLGVTQIPSTTAEFKALVDTFQAAGDLDAVAMLIQLAPEMANFIDLTGQLTGVIADTNAIAQQAYDLQTQLLQLQGNTVELRARELALLDPSNQALQQQIWLLTDQQAAAQAAADALDAANQATQAIADEFNGLQDQLWGLQGNTDALRAEQLASLDASNRAIQEQIWALQDQQTAADAAAQALSDMTAAAQQLADSLNENMFATLLDYQVAYADALYSIPVATYAPGVTVTGGTSTSAAQQSTDQSMALLQSILNKLDDIQSDAAIMGAEGIGYTKTIRDKMNQGFGDAFPTRAT